MRTEPQPAGLPALPGSGRLSSRHILGWEHLASGSPVYQGDLSASNSFDVHRASQRGIQNAAVIWIRQSQISEGNMYQPHITTQCSCVCKHINKSGQTKCQNSCRGTKHVHIYFIWRLRVLFNQTKKPQGCLIRKTMMEAYMGCQRQ